MADHDYAKTQLVRAINHLDAANPLLALDAARRAMDAIDRLATVAAETMPELTDEELAELFDAPTERPEPLPEITDEELDEIFGNLFDAPIEQHRTASNSIEQ